MGRVAVSGKEQKYQSDQVKHLPHLQQSMAHPIPLQGDLGWGNTEYKPWPLAL